MKQIYRIFMVSGMIFSLVLGAALPLAAQTQQTEPQPGFSYQAVARDSDGTPLKSAALTVRIAIHENGADGTLIWQEDHDVTTSEFGLFNLVVGGEDACGTSGKVESLGAIDWSSSKYYMNVQVKKDAGFLDMGGSPIQTVPMAQYAKSGSGNFSVKATDIADPGEALFEVKRSDGSVAFAVYEDMTWVYAKDDGTKGLKGGFAVGGYNAAKAEPTNLLSITPDSIRMYINDGAAKGLKGGFAVGGYNTNAKGLLPPYLTVTGSNLIDDDYAITLGVGAEASGKYATAIGYNSLASGYPSLSAGLTSQATNSNSIAIGNSALSSGANATAMGYRSKAEGERSIAIGSYYQHSFYLPIFNLGKKGSDDSKADLYPFLPIYQPIFQPISFTRENKAVGKYSIAFGNGNLAENGGMALGSYNNADGDGSVSIGLSNDAIRRASFAAGYNSRAEGYYATAFGNNAQAQAYGSFVIGQYNSYSGDSTEWVSTDPLFVVGNGLNNDNRSNALTINKNGQTIFSGENASSYINYRRTWFNFLSGTTTRYLYGVRSYVDRGDDVINYYYSGYFYGASSGSGTYNGLYADVRTGASIDVAEYIYDSNGNTEPGDVLVADPNVNESVLLSDQAYQTSVVGVVSTKPHMVMGMELVMDEETGEMLPDVQATRLALTGRVPCKVTDENGPIQPGDLLTTSATPGHAMKWTPLDVNAASDFDEMKQILSENEMRRHAVIGKALEAHSGGTGKIMVLISLQ